MSDNPYMKRQAARASNDHGKVSEKRVAKKLGAQLTPASGAFVGGKGDMRKRLGDRKFVIEAKSTVHDSLSLQRDWLLKIQNEALAAGGHAALTVSFVLPDGKPRPMGEWVLIPAADYAELMEAASSGK